MAQVLLSSLEHFGINLKYIRSQGYDGASAMQGKFNGVQSIISQKYLLVLYLHCSSHSLNLVISNAYNIHSIRNTLGTIQTVGGFFNTPKRQAILQNTIERLIPETRKKIKNRLNGLSVMNKHCDILMTTEDVPNT